jgi:hypothetical protein
LAKRHADWTAKGATLSHVSAQKEFGLSLEEILVAVRQGKLQYRENHIHGNPYLRLLRSEVEALVAKKWGRADFARKKLKNELARIDRELRKLKAQVRALEKKRLDLLDMIGE